MTTGHSCVTVVPQLVSRVFHSYGTVVSLTMVRLFQKPFFFRNNRQCLTPSPAIHHPLRKHFLRSIMMCSIYPLFSIVFWSLYKQHDEKAAEMMGKWQENSYHCHPTSLMTMRSQAVFQNVCHLIKEIKHRYTDS